MKDLSTSEIGTLVSTYDWSKTPLGAAETWSAELQAAVELLVTESDRAKNSSDNHNPSLFKTQRRYDALLHEIKKGFVISEMLFNSEGKPFDHRYLEINHLFETMTGLENAIGKTALELIPDLEPFWAEIYGRVVLTGEPVEFEHEVKALNRWFEVKAFPIDTPLEFRFGILFTDITERKLAEHQIKLIQERLGISLAAGDVGVWDLDLVSKHAWRSIEHDRIFGYEELLPEWTYDQFLSRIITEDRARVDLAFQNAIANRIPLEFECGIITPQGEIRWIWGKARTEYDKNGEAIRIYGVNRDISDRYREEQNTKFLSEIQKDLNSIANINQMLNVVSEKIRARYGFSVLGFSDVDIANNICSTFHVSSNDCEISQIATYFMPDFFSESQLRRLQEEGIVAINDVFNDPEIKDQGFAYKNFPTPSTLNISYMSEGEWKFMIGGARSETCIWRKDEIDLISELIPRIYLEIERSRSEAALAKANQRFESAMLAVEGIIFEWNMDTNFVYRSNGLFNLIGIEAEDAPPTSDWWFDLIHPEDQTNVESLFAQLKSNDDRYQFEYRVRHADGRWIDVWEKGNLKRSEAGEIVEVIGFTSDISDRKRSEVKIRQSESQLRRILDNLFSFVGILTTDGTLIEANHTALVAASLSAADVLGKPFPDAYWWAYDKEIQAQLWAAIRQAATGETVRYDVQIRLGEDQFIVIDFCIAPLLSDSGGVEFLIPSGINITDRIRAELAVKKINQRFEAAMDAVDGIIFEWSMDTNFVFRSQGLFNLIGVEADDAPSTSEWWFNLIHPEDQPNIESFFAQINPNNDRYQFEYRVRHADGRWLDVWEKGNLKRNEAGEIVEVIGFTSDISDRKQIEKELEERNQELNRFSYIISHDLKAPLRGISNLADWISDDLPPTVDPDILTNLELMRLRVARMDSLIDGLLEYARVGSITSSLETFSVEQLLAEIVDWLSIPESFIVELPTELPPITTHRVLLSQVLANLIGNAYKHHDRLDGRIQVTVQPDTKMWKFSVTDDGCGIPPENQEQIFDIFKTVSGTNKNNTGIGLSIVKKLVETKGGKISLESQIGIGTTFNFTWFS